MIKIIKSLINKTLFSIFMAYTFIGTAHSQPITQATKNILGQYESSYDDAMAITLESKLVVDVVVKKIKKLPPTQTIGVRTDRQRILIIANVQSLIRAESGLNGEIKFLYDAPLDSRGKIPKLKKQRFLAFGRNVRNRPDFIKLTYVDSIIPYNGNINNVVRNSIAEAIADNAAQKITGISSAFHSPGTIIGEGETQIFLDTEFGQPMAISVTRRSGERPRWSVSTSEVIDINATEPKRRSLIGHRLACYLPQNIPASVIETNNGAGKSKAIADYDYVRKAIGPCQRNIRWNR